MKYVVILGDGMADYAIDCLGKKTPLMVAKKPNVDALARIGEVGLCKTVPDGMKPGSDVANLSVLGYNPTVCYTGRSPLEAASIGIDIKETDVTARANLVTLSDEQNFIDKKMVDYSAGEISTAEAKQLISYLKKHLDDDKYSLYAGISYRHCLVVNNGDIASDLTPPHDITGQAIKGHLPTSETGSKYLALMKKSYELLKNHPINVERVKNGKNPANSLWFWGEGTKPKLEDFYSKFNLKGGIISAVDLLKGIGKLTNMKVIEVEGATGNYDTNFIGKANACLDALKSGLDFVYVHMEAPDECGHHGDLERKIFSIEEIDSKVVKVIKNGLDEMGEDYAILIMPDHPTPIAIKTHCSDSVPYLIYRSNKKYNSSASGYDEEQARKSGITVDNGYLMMQKLINE